MTALHKVFHRNNRRRYDVVITAEHPKGLGPSWHGLVVLFSKQTSVGNQSRRHGGFGGLSAPKKLQVPQN